MNKNVKMSLSKAQKIFEEEFSERTQTAVAHHLLAESLWHNYILHPTQRNHDMFVNVCKELFNTS